MTMTFSNEKIHPSLASTVPSGRSADLLVARYDDQSLLQPVDPTLDLIHLPQIQQDFLRIVSFMAPDGFTVGTTFFRALPSERVEVNETHRDKGSGVLNFTALVGFGKGAQLEFFDNDDEGEQDPTYTPHGYVQMFTKELHRRPACGPLPGPRVFLSANLYQN